MPQMTQTLPLLALTSGVVLPGMVFTMALETEDSRVAAEAAGSAGGRLVLVPRIEGRYASIGVVAEIVEMGELPGGPRAMVVRGLERGAIGTGVPGTGRALWVQVDPITEAPATPTTSELAREYRAVLENILLSWGARQIAERLRDVTEPSQIADLAGYSPELSLAQKVQVLQTLDVEERLRLVLGWARGTLADLTLRQQIKSSVEEGMEKTQREFLLRRQLDAIRKELGELEGNADDGTPEHYRTVLAERDLPDAVRSAVEREITKLERMSDQSPEQGWVRTWIDTVLEIPWGVTSQDRLDVNEAARVLDEDHDGLVDVKERILEHLAVRALQAERGLVPVGGRGAGATLALVGPPGVGKTSLGESVARALGRRFVRVSLGGVHDEAEIRGHRRTYVGAKLGRLARASREAGTMNPVIVLDEVDKVGSDYRGDPLLGAPGSARPGAEPHVPGPLPGSRAGPFQGAVHRHGQRDRDGPGAVAGPYGGHPDRRLYRGGKAGHRPQPPPPPPARADRVAVRRGGGQRRRPAGRVGRLHEGGRRAQPGTRAGRMLRKVATKLAGGSVQAPVVIGPADVRSWLGRPRFFFEAADRTSVPGVATGLAVTGTGGDVLFIEATTMDGPEGLTLTGQLGDVMKESAEIVLSHVRGHSQELGIPEGAFAGKRFHVHVPAGAVPKDGPSAGVTMVAALTSLLLGRPVRPVVGMTGEVTLQGRVLPIGGVKQKVLAAYRAGLQHVVLPARNGPDLEDVPEEVRAKMAFTLAETVDDVLRVALADEQSGTGANTDLPLAS